jgi:hypothetical protein
VKTESSENHDKYTVYLFSCMCYERTMELYQTCPLGEQLKDKSCHKICCTKNQCVMDRHILSESDLELIGVQIPCGSNISSITNMHVQNITPTYVVGLVVILWKSSSVKIF